MTRVTLFCLLVAGTPACSQVYQIASPNAQMLGHFGDSAAIVPDVDGDGVADVLIGAPGESVNGFANAGRVYVVSGLTGALIRTITPPNDESDQEFGECVAGVPDTNGDGRGEILIGSPDADPDFSPSDSGRAYLYSGGTGLRLWTLASPAPETDGSFGDEVAAIPDINGDGRSELLISATKEDAGAFDAGRVYIFSSLTGTLISAVQSLNPDVGGDFGDSLSGVPDANGDGVADFAVGAPAENPNGFPTNCGRAYLISGATRLLLRQMQSVGQEIDGGFGESIVGLPDVDGDGRGDVLVGAPRENPNGSPADCGRAHLYSGASGVHLHRFIPPSQQDGGNFGSSLAWMPDRTGDGRPEVLISAWREYPTTVRPSQPSISAPALALDPVAARRPGGGTTGGGGSGRVHIYAGGAWTRLATLNSPAPVANGGFGRAVGAFPVGGIVRIIVGASSESSATTAPASGRSYLIPF